MSAVGRRSLLSSYCLRWSQLGARAYSTTGPGGNKPSDTTPASETTSTFGTTPPSGTTPSADPDAPVVSTKVPEYHERGDFFFGDKWTRRQLPYDKSRVLHHPGESRLKPVEHMRKEWQGYWKMPKRHWDGLIECPVQTDVLIVGGGIVGSSVAYWLKQHHLEGFNVTVVEKDPQYSRCATTLSVGGIRQQFSLPENILLSKFTAEFLRNINENLGVIGCDSPDVGYQPFGYLFLAPDEVSAQKLEANVKLQVAHGAKVRIFSSGELKERWPWLNCDDVYAGSFGFEDEGCIDPWSLLQAFKLKNESMMVQYIKGEVVDLEPVRDAINESAFPFPRFAYVRLPSGDIQPVRFAHIINCAGPWAKRIAEMALIGQGPDVLQVGLPVEPRKRYVYVFHCPDGPGLDMPKVIDPTGVYVRREGLGGTYLCGLSPTCDEEEPPTDNLDVDMEWFNERIWPVLAHRIPAFEKLKVRTAWAGYYDYNTFDQNLVIGPHPSMGNFWFCNGLSGHGLQHAAAIGRSFAELFFERRYISINLERFHFSRILERQPLLEINIV